MLDYVHVINLLLLIIIKNEQTMSIKTSLLPLSHTTRPYHGTEMYALYYINITAVAVPSTS